MSTTEDEQAEYGPRRIYLRHEVEHAAPPFPGTNISDEELISYCEHRRGNVYLVLASKRLRELAKARQQLAAREGDGSICNLQSLAAYFHENRNCSALKSIYSAAHAAGWCIDDGGADKITPLQIGMRCPLCDEMLAL